MASLINAQLVAMGKDDVKGHIFQYLHSVFSSRNERLICYVWYVVSLRKEKKKKTVFNLNTDTVLEFFFLSSSFIVMLGMEPGLHAC